MKMLKVDIDVHPPKEWLNKWLDTREAIIEKEGLSIEYSKTFQTKRGFHAYFKLTKNLPDEEINKLQFLLGDDATRVKINAWRIKRGIKRWNKLFHKVLYRRKAKVLTCYYCGNKIPVPNRWLTRQTKLPSQDVERKNI